MRNPDSVVLEQLDTNKDDRMHREEFGSHFRQPATEQLENTTAEEKAQARLSEVSQTIDSKKDDTVNEEKRATKLCVEEEWFNALLVEAGLNTNFKVLEQLDGDSDKQGTWGNFYHKLKEAAKAKAKATGDAAALTEIKIEGAGTIMLVCCL